MINSEFPGSSINFSPYENDNISVTGPVDKIAQLHKRVLEGIKAAIENKHSPVTVILPSRENIMIAIAMANNYSDSIVKYICAHYV